VPIPLRINKLSIIHIASQRLLSDAAKRDSSSIKSSKKGRVPACENSHSDLSFIVHVVKTKDSARVIKRSQRKLEIVNITHRIPMVSYGKINLRRLDTLTRTHQVALNKKRLIIPSLNGPLIVIIVFDRNYMRVFLVFTPISTLINPFSIILAQSFEIDP